ncbi:MAG: ATP-binding protein [Kiritimatiellae bacterium]|nr:ATP-binding protein [Kiritimatiellia bacterium]
MIERIVAPKIKSLWTQYPIVTLTGPRQSGKTTLARTLFPDADYVNLEAPDVLHEAVHDARAFLARHPAPAIFDEVQRCPELLSYLQVAVDDAERNQMYLLTGSHQPALLGAVSQSLAGRTALVDLYPLSIPELKRSGLTKSRDGWMLEGFLPRLYDTRRGIPQFGQLYRDYFRTYVERDVRQLANLRDAGLFETFIKLLAGRVGQEVNALDLAGSVGVSAPTIRSWITLLEASFIVFILRPYYRNFGKRLVKAPKIYFTEPGLAAWLLGIRTEEQMSTHPLVGNLFENMVVMEAVKARCNAAEDINLHFYRAPDGLEIDLLQENAQHLRPIEIKSAQTYHPDMGRNLLRFTRFAENVERPTVVYAGRSVPSKTGISAYSFEDDWIS